MATIKINNSTTWGLTINEFNTGLFGNEIGDFKATNDLLVKYAVISTDGSLDAAKLQAMFNQLSTTIIYRFVGKIEYLNDINFTSMPLDYQREMRFAVYKELSNAIKNDLFEKRSNNDVQTSGFNQNTDLSGWTIPADAISVDTWERLEKIIRVYDYELIDGVLYYKGAEYDPAFATGEFLSTVSLIGQLRQIYLKDQIDLLIAKTLSSNKSFLGVANTATLTNITTNYDVFLKAQFPDAVQGSSAEIRLVDDQSLINGLLESYTFSNNS